MFSNCSIYKSLILACLLLGACNPFYVARSAYDGALILAKRQDIEKLIEANNLPESKQTKLALVLAARQFAKEIGLTPGDSFTTFSQIDRDVISWVVLAARNDSFMLHTWWFPIVGRLPYKGYFRQRQAIAAAQRFDSQKFDTIVRPVEAYSTLGWFNDPLLSTTLRKDPVSIVELVLHELTHNTVWLNDHVSFNESLATFIGIEGVVDFFRSRVEKCLRNKEDCQQEKELHLLAIHNRDRTLDLAVLIEILYNELDQLYQSDLSHSEKLRQRKEIFSSSVSQIKQNYPQLKILKEINNAELMQLRLYLSDLQQFQLLYNHSRDWPAFFSRVKKIQTKVLDGQVDDPFEALRQSLIDRTTKCSDNKSQHFAP